MRKFCFKTPNFTESERERILHTNDLYVPQNEGEGEGGRRRAKEGEAVQYRLQFEGYGQVRLYVDPNNSQT